MSTAALWTAWACAAVNLAAAGWGGWRWWTVESSRLFWVLARTGQGAAVAQALVAGALFVAGYDPPDGLYWLYALLPVAIGVIAEQLRILSAEQVLERRALAGVEALRARPEAEQRSVVREIVRREIGVMTVAAIVVAFLALRAALIV
ncbi:MAG TPA: hypothetical protein VGW11_04645 [Solirubrobacteraceae bacterium]|nr:hypothetical protein [Solirubrobacteraceae bacterium]